MYHGYTGPRPTTFYESPMSYQLVKAGKLPKLDDRVPPAEERPIVQGLSGIGYYGGEYRFTGTGASICCQFNSPWVIRDSDGVTWMPYAGKSFEISDDGKTYTMHMRQNMFWSDGMPFTSEDMRFTWEDNNLNKDLNATLPVTLRDPVTDNAIKFALIDDLTWTLTYDTANFILYEDVDLPRGSCRKTGLGTVACPAHFLKQFHPDYADASALQTMINAEGLEDWTQLYTRMASYRTLGVPADEKPPTLDAIVTTVTKDLQTTGERNHYFVFFDVEGNQLPYMDGAQGFKVESRDAMVFRAMNGETDGDSSQYDIGEVPLYTANMDKGDYSIYKWGNPDGMDHTLALSLVFNKTEMGKWLRTKDFRRALSYGLDREAINDTLYLGIGTIQAWVPHPSTPYYPGDEYAQVNIGYDVDLANSLLDGIGLTNKDSDGFRLLESGQRVALDAAISLGFDVNGVALMEIVQPMWEEIGIETTFSERDDWYSGFKQGDYHVITHISMAIYQVNPFSTADSNVVALNASYMAAPGVGTYISSRGELGMMPGPNPSYLPLAPADTYPVDVSGNMKKLQEMFQEGRQYLDTDPRRIELGKEMFRIYNEELYGLPIIAYTGLMRGTFINRNNVLNQPKIHFPQSIGGYTNWSFYFDGGTAETRGMDNVNHPDNKSSFKSFSFLTGE
jgi:peptide/nickel transport system substrate-binding protein